MQHRKLLLNSIFFYCLANSSSFQAESSYHQNPEIDDNEVTVDKLVTATRGVHFQPGEIQLRGQLRCKEK